MNVNIMCQAVEEMYSDACIVADENLCTCGWSDGQKETMKGLHTIITLSMQCLEIMLRNGHIQRVSDGNSLIQDNDPYIEGLLDSIRKRKTIKG